MTLPYYDRQHSTGGIFMLKTLTITILKGEKGRSSLCQTLNCLIVNY